MYPPTTKIFVSKELAYEYYNKIKKDLMIDIYDDGTSCTRVYNDENGETVIQNGEDVKRPQGVSIQYVRVIGDTKE